MNKIEFGVIEEGDYTVIKHNAGHNVPKLIDDQMDQLIDFMQKVYFNRFGNELMLEEIINNDYKKNFISSQKERMTAKL